MKKRTIEECDVKSKRVLLRVDFNVPMDGEGNVSDDTKIRYSIDTIRYLNDNKAKLIILSHLGRPGGKFVKNLSLEPVCETLSDILHKNISLAPSLYGEETEEMIEEMLPGDIIMLENTRFDPGEEKNASSLAKKLASYGDIFVNDAFSVSHRKHASIVGIAKYLETYAGFRLQSDIEKLSGIFERIEKPLTILLGGTKIEHKIELIKNFVNKVDNVLVGGELANFILHAQGYDLGEYYDDKDKAKKVKAVMKTIEDNIDKIKLPTDVVVSDEISDDAETAVIPIRFMHPKLKILDIGPETIENFQDIISDSATVVWSGPLSNVQTETFLKGTEQIAEAIANKYGNTVVGGTETLAALQKLDISDSRFTHIGAGGSAMLEYLQKGTLPGVENIPKVWGL